MGLMNRTKSDDMYDQISVFHYYLCSEVLDNLPEDKSIADILGYGEDCFVQELYEYSKLFFELVNNAVKKGCMFRGVPVYDVSEELGRDFWKMTDCDEWLPSLEQFEIMTTAAIRKTSEAI